MKRFGKIAVTFLMAILTSGVLLAQTEPESRLNVGKDARKSLVPATTPPFMGKLPEKLNFDSRAEFTQFYRNLLLKNPSQVKSETVATRAVESVGEKIKFGNMYPNPAVNFVEIPYEVQESFKEARVTIMNMVGAPLLEHPLSASASRLRVNTTSLDSGIYMVQFVVDGKKVGTKKLLVERN